MNNPIQHILSRGCLGAIATTGGFAISLSDVEIWLRIISLLVGIAVGLASLWSILRKKAPKFKARALLEDGEA